MDINDFNHCSIPNCNCGWNISLGGVSQEELDELRRLLKGKIIIDHTDYEAKIGTEKF